MSEKDAGPAGASEKAVVSLSDVTRRFGDVVAVDRLSLDLRRGEFFSLLGPSGCGKTTTLRMIAGFDEPSGGLVEILGMDVSGLPPNKRPVNTVFQNYALFGHLNVFQNVAFGLRERRTPKAEIAERVHQALRLVRLTGYEGRKPSQLSGGEQQRVALARAVVNEPAVLLLDEPLGALDLNLRRAMQLELKAIQQRLGITFLYVTHDQEEALTMSDRVGVMERGRLAQVGTPQEIYDRPSNPYVADFVGEANILSGTVVAIDGEIVAVSAWGSTVRGRGARSTPNADARVMVRPQTVSLVPADQTGRRVADGGALTGRVSEVVFVGDHWRFTVTGPVGEVLVATSPNRGGEDAAPHRVGDDVCATWSAEDAWVIPDERLAADRQ